MRLGVRPQDCAEFHHDVRSSFGELLRAALCGAPVAVAHGPVYEDDPAEEVLAPFVRSAQESGWSFDELILPDWTVERARSLREAEVWQTLWKVPDIPDFMAEVDRWTRAGLVLEIASRWGIPRVTGRVHPKWKLRGTVTGRFGIEAGSKFNPMTIPEDARNTIVASQGYVLEVIDFNAMDLRSMISLIPDMVQWYDDAEDLHQRTADIMDISREEAKHEIFVHVYGGRSRHHDRFCARMPYLYELRSGEHGEGARRVQAQSARAFRAALSEALPLLVSEQVRPLFTVHDEVVLEVHNQTGDRGVSRALERGAERLIGVPYRVKVRFGHTYGDCKSG